MWVRLFQVNYVLHDWSNELALAILRQLLAAAYSDTQLFTIDKTVTCLALEDISVPGAFFLRSSKAGQPSENTPPHLIGLTVSATRKFRPQHSGCSGLTFHNTMLQALVF